jgi:hypothetical protein
MANPIVTPTAFERWIGRLVAPRMGGWLYLTLVLLALVWWFAEHMLKVLLYKGVIITMAAFMGDKIARAMEGRGPRPHQLREEAELKAQTYEDVRAFHQRADAILYRRAIVIAAVVIAAALGS